MRRIGFCCALTTLLGCGPDDPALCRPGFLRAADGHCYPPPPDDPDPVVEDALENLPPCFLHKPIGDIDLEAGCADGACADDPIEAWVEALGPADSCESPSFSDTLSTCVWDARGIEGLFADEDQDGQPDVASTSGRVHLLPGHPGATIEGLGTDQGPRCYIDVLGMPDEVRFTRIGGTLMVEELFYEDLGLQVNDWITVDGPSHADGVIDNLFLFGPE